MIVEYHILFETWSSCSVIELRLELPRIKGRTIISVHILVLKQVQKREKHSVFFIHSRQRNCRSIGPRAE